MCMFSDFIGKVSDTQIFARGAEAASRIVLPDQVCWRAPLEAALENRDTWIGPGSRLPSSGTA
jgi:hypothetical protein